MRSWEPFERAGTNRAQPFRPIFVAASNSDCDIPLCLTLYTEQRNLDCGPAKITFLSTKYILHIYCAEFCIVCLCILRDAFPLVSKMLSAECTVEQCFSSAQYVSKRFRDQINNYCEKKINSSQSLFGSG